MSNQNIKSNNFINTIILLFLWILTPFITLYNVIFGSTEKVFNFRDSDIDYNQIRLGGFKKIKKNK